MNKLISFIRRKILRIERDRWNHKYASNNWDNLHLENERFNAVINMCYSVNTNPSILEIGCGEAVMFQKMKDKAITYFTGVDISDVAIERAKPLEQDNIRFEVGDMETYEPKKSYDLIIFNESLYYSKRPELILKKIVKHLAPNGYIIITAIENKYTAHLWPAVHSLHWSQASEAIIEVKSDKWFVKMYQP